MLLHFNSKPWWIISRWVNEVEIIWYNRVFYPKYDMSSGLSITQNIIFNKFQYLDFGLVWLKRVGSYVSFSSFGWLVYWNSLSDIQSTIGLFPNMIRKISLFFFIRCFAKSVIDCKGNLCFCITYLKTIQCKKIIHVMIIPKIVLLYFC